MSDCFGSGSYKEEQLDDAPVDFPRVDDRTVGLPSRYGYAMGLDSSAETLTFDHYLYKYDLTDGSRIRHDLGDGAHGSEPVFAATSADAKDNDGFVLSFVHDDTTNQSKLLVIDARNFDSTSVAEIALPQRVPYGARGSWLPSSC